MDTRRRYGIGFGLVALSAAASALAYPEMPARMVTYWNAAGEPDGETSRLVALALFPALSAAVLGLFAVLPRIDPLGENVEDFREQYYTFVAPVVSLLIYVHLLVLAWNAGYRFEPVQALAPAIGVLFYSAGGLLERAERNWFVGIRTPWTLSSDEVWKRTHERAGPLFRLAGVVAMLGALVPAYAVLLVVGPVVAVAAYTTVYSYLEYRRTAAS